MKFDYTPLWHMLLDREMTKTQMRERTGLTTNALAKLNKNESVPLATLGKICITFGCTLDDIVKIIEIDN